MSFTPFTADFWGHLPEKRIDFRVLALGCDRQRVAQPGMATSNSSDTAPAMAGGDALAGAQIEALTEALARIDRPLSAPPSVALPEGQAWTLTLTPDEARSLGRALTGAAGHRAPVADWFVLPAGMRFRALACDMDNTCVNGETLDRAAAMAGLGEAVAALTAGSTAGQLDFTASLAERARLMQGITLETLEAVGQRAAFNPGIEALVAAANRAGALTLLVTGGFEPTAAVVAKRLGFKTCIANRIGMAEGRMTGTLAAPVVDGPGKRTRLGEALAAAGIDPQETIAIGDGANDIEMLGAVGLGIAWRATRALRETTPWRLDRATLAAVRDLAGWR